MKFQQHTLSNGLQLVAECNPQAYSTAIAFFVNTGARDESPEVAGVSHFLEHMLFKGTPNRSAEEVNRELDELGSHANAFTSEEHTVYYATVLPEYQEQLVALLADMMRPSLRQDDFDSEKKVILEEILKYEDQPPFGAAEKCMEAYFGAHPLANSVLGSLDSVSALAPEKMRSYFDARYSPGNISLVACGNVDFPALIKSAEEHCGQWEPFETARKLEAAAGKTGLQRIEKQQASQEYTIMMSRGPTAENPLRFAARLLAYTMGDDGGSRLYWELVDSGLAEYACTATYEFQGEGVMMTYLCGGPAEAAANLDSIKKVYADVTANGVSSDELELAKSKVCSQLVRRSERPSSRLFAVGNGWFAAERIQNRKGIDRGISRRDTISDRRGSRAFSALKHDDGLSGTWKQLVRVATISRRGLACSNRIWANPR